MGRREGRREEDHPGARHHPRGDHERGGERRQGPDKLAAVEGMLGEDPLCKIELIP